MRKPNSTFLWMLTLSLFVPLVALADGQAMPEMKPAMEVKPEMKPAMEVKPEMKPATEMKPEVKPAAAMPTLQIGELSDDELARGIAAYKARLADERTRAAANTLSAGFDAAKAEEAQKLLDSRKGSTKPATDTPTKTDPTKTETKTEVTTKEKEKTDVDAGATIPEDVTTWDGERGLKKLIPDLKVVYDRAAGDKDYAASVHLEGTIPTECVNMIGAGATDFIAKYDGSQKIDSLGRLSVPFRGWNIRTSSAAQDCVDKFLKKNKAKSSAAYCKAHKDACLFLKEVTKIDKLSGGPKIGFYACEGEDDCKVEFYGDGKSEDDVKRVADSSTYDSAKKRIGSSTDSRKLKLQLWKIQNVGQCYGYGKKMSLTDFFNDVAAIKGKVKDDLSVYVKKGLNAEIARLKGLAETGKTVSELPAFSSEVAAFYTKYLGTSRSDVKNPDLDLMRRAVLALFKTMERRVLDDESALRNPSSARSNAEAIISQALTLAPDDINLKNELEAGIKVDTTVLALQRKQVAYANLVKQCQQNPGNCDQQRLYAMQVSLQKATQSAAQYYQKLQLSAYKQCASGKKRSSDPFDDAGLIVDGSDEGDDDVTFTSRCDAAKDNLNRVWRRVQEASTAVQGAAGANPQIVQQLSQQINGQNSLPNATITPGQNGYNPALAYALDPNRFPGNFSSDYLHNLVPMLQPSTSLGSGSMCLAQVGQVSNCFPTGPGITVQGQNGPPSLPVRPL